jgi:hypothetical protein
LWGRVAVDKDAIATAAPFLLRSPAREGAATETVELSVVAAAVVLAELLVVVVEVVVGGLLLATGVSLLRAAMVSVPLWVSLCLLGIRSCVRRSSRVIVFFPYRETPTTSIIHSNSGGVSKLRSYTKYRRILVEYCIYRRSFKTTTILSFTVHLSYLVEMVQ